MPKRYKLERLAPIVKQLPVDERKAITAAAVAFAKPKVSTREATDKLERIIYARHRTEQRRKSDRETDQKRRILIGARVPRDKGEQYRQIATAQGMSLNRWVAAALDTAAARQGW